MLADATGSQSRFLLRIVHKVMFHFVYRQLKIQEDTFYTTIEREWDQLQPATANGHAKKKRLDNANL